ncbi:unnamed protein product [Adineta steineri]|uniref:Uncharacterized protein n=1 Tax=Adineta steineri TaxID=433720 RepID=A0A815ZS13_9BILA|nr:unnamed protein product [Adineta steineri]CAF1585818.1 unnamed protein product [Adineta steineri]
MLQQKNHKRRRKTSTVQSGLLNASNIDSQYNSTITMSNKQNRRQNNMREILSRQFMQQSGHKRWRTGNNTQSNDIRRLLPFGSDSSSSYEYEHRSERQLHDAYVIDVTRANRYEQQQRRSREPPPVLEQSPPSYDSSIGQTRRQQIPFQLPVRTTTNTHQPLSTITPSVYSAMPPSYAEIFLKPQTTPNE